MSDTQRRTLRTAFQTLLGFLAVVAVALPFADDFGVPAGTVAAVGAGVVSATAMVTAVMNKLEDLGVFKDRR